MNSKISLDTQEQLIEQAKAAAKEKYDNKLLADQAEEIKNLLLMNNLSDPNNFRTEMKPRKEYSHFEDNLPSGEDLMSMLNNPEAVKYLSNQYRETTAKDKELPSIALESMEGKELLSPEDKRRLSEDAAREMEGYTPGVKPPIGRALFAEQSMKSYNPSRATDTAPIVTVKNSEGVDRGGSKAPSSFGTFKDNLDGSIPEGLLDDPEGLKRYKYLKENYPEGNYWMKTLGNPKIDEALKAIADKDPELLQLPEIQSLLKRSKAGYDKQLALTTVAPFTSNPEMWMSQANAWREQGDKNLMDAANNLETLRQRQLDATKAVADNLTQQKSIAGSMHNAVLGLEGNLAQVAIPSIQQANDLKLQAEQVHYAGDEAIKSAISNMQTFVQRLNNMGANKTEVALLNTEAEKLNPANIKEFIKKVNGIKINRNMRKEFNERLNEISNQAAQYETAMLNAKRLEEQSKFHMDKVNGLMTSASNLGGEYKIPEWMNNKSDIPITTPKEKTNNEPSNEIQIKQDTMDGTQSRAKSPLQVPSKTQSGESNGQFTAGQSNTEVNPKQSSATFDPWSAESFAKLNANQLKNNIEALSIAYAKRGSGASKVGIYQTEKDAEGSDVANRKELVVNVNEENMGALLRNLGGLRSSNKAKYKAIINSLSPNALGIIEAATERTDPILSQDAYNAKNGKKISQANPNIINDQNEMIQRLMLEAGYV